jgi:hypothetical protein
MIMRVVLVVLLLMAPVFAATGCAGPGTLTLPVEVSTTEALGAVAFYLIYDASLLEVTGVDPADLAEGADSGFNSDTPGRLLVVVQQAPSIDGDGTLVDIQFDILEGEGQSSIGLEDVQVKLLATGDRVSVRIEAGSVQADDASYVAPRIIYEP